jgi:hypothetical protein
VSERTAYILRIVDFLAAGKPIDNFPFADIREAREVYACARAEQTAIPDEIWAGETHHARILSRAKRGRGKPKPVAATT